MIANLIYIIALTALSPLILYRMVRHGRYRRGIAEKLCGLSPQRAAELGSDRCVWFHAVSLGEVNLLPGVVRHYQASRPDCTIVVSTSTDTGYDAAVKHFGADRVFFCPLDFTWAVMRTIRNLRPEMLVLAELELWPNLIRIADQLNCGVAVINARLSQRSADGYQRFARFTRPTFARLSLVGCQDEDAAVRFSACGAPRDSVQITGSMKFDDAPMSRDNLDVQSRFQWAGIDPWHRVWIFGSTQTGEEQMALDIYRSLRVEHPELRLILVPRHPERFDAVAGLITRASLTAHRRSSDESLYDDEWSADKVILVDTLGELKHWWGVSHIATVGGSFVDRGGQNMLEPAGYGSAVSFGPDTRNFKEIAERLLDAGGAIRVSDQAELKQFVRRCLTDQPAADSLGRAARAVIREHRGATERTVRALIELRAPAEGSRRVA